MPLPMIAWNAEGRIAAWNPAATDLLGYDAQETVGRLMFELIPESARPRMAQIARDLFQNGQALHSVNENWTKDGRSLWCEWHNTLLQNDDGTVRIAISSARDLTRHYRMEREREQLQAIAFAANAPHDLDEILLLVRSSVMALGGFDRVSIWLIEDDLLRGTWGTDEAGNLRDEWQFTHALKDYAMMPFLRAHDGNLYFIDKKNYYITPDLAIHDAAQTLDFAGVALQARGEMVGVIYFDNLLTRRPIRPDDIETLLPFIGQAALAIANARLLIERERLITRRRRLLETVTAINSDLSLDEILLLARDTVVENGDFDRAGVFTICDGKVYGSWGTDEKGQRRAEHDLIYPREAWADILEPFANPALQYRLFTPDRVLEPGLTRSFPKAVIALRAGGDLTGLLFVDNLITERKIREEDVALLLSLTEQTAAVIHNIQLISELRTAQDALIRSEKLRAVGELASGVAHNVNNVLAAVLGYAELIQDTEGVSAEVCEFARTIERAAIDGAEIVRRVQSFARRETEPFQSVFDLNQVAREAVDLTRPAWLNQAMSRGARIEIVTEFAGETRVRGVASEIREVLVNLIRNAVDAMPQGGVLTLRCGEVGGMAEASATDTGIGMDEQTRMRVFEPFFTTKGVGLGTGLGLSVAWGILDRHKGRIEAESEAGGGSIFRIRLPLADGPVPETPTATPASVAGLRILIVEDETFVLEGLARTLDARKAMVHMAEDAQEALAWLEANADSCDIILSDHGMVGMTGLQLLEKVKAQYPAIRRVLLSGWGDNPPGGVSTDSAERILTKPVRAEALIATLAPLRRRDEGVGC